MNTEIEDRLALSLRDRADRDVDTGTLLTGAVRRGRRRLVRQRVGWLGVIVLLTAGMVTFGALRPYPVGGHHPVTPASRGSSHPPVAGPAGGWNDLTARALDAALVPPAASAGTPTALQDPSAVGTDPGLLHLDVAALPGHYVAADWTSGPGLEKLALYDTDEQARRAAGANTLGTGADVYLATATAALPELTSGAVRDGAFALGGVTVTDYLVGGTSGAQPTEGTTRTGYRVLRWQPAAGLWLQVTATTDDRKARLVAAAVRLDAVHRCVVPYRLDQPPAGTASGCDLTLGTARATTMGLAPGAASQYTLTRGSGQLTVVATAYTGIGCAVAEGAAVRLAGGTGRWSTGGQGTTGRLEVCQPIGGLQVGVTEHGSGYGQTDAVQAVDGLRAAGQAARLDTWAASPLS